MNRLAGVFLFAAIKLSWSSAERYLIKSDKTDHMAMHNGAALKKLSQKKPVSRR